MYWSIGRDAGHLSIGVGNLMVHLWPYREFRGWGRCGDHPDLQVIGLGPIVTLAWQRVAVPAPPRAPKEST